MAFKISIAKLSSNKESKQKHLLFDKDPVNFYSPTKELKVMKKNMHNNNC